MEDVPSEFSHQLNGLVFTGLAFRLPLKMLLHYELCSTIDTRSMQLNTEANMLMNASATTVVSKRDHLPKMIAHI